MEYKVSKRDRSLIGEVTLPPTRRINNRHLLIRALRRDNLKTENQKEWKKQELRSSYNLRLKKLPLETLAAISYLKLYFKKKQGDWVVFGSKKLKKGPIKSIIKKLENIGGNIRYEESEEFKPIQLTGSCLKGSVKQINAIITRDLITVSLFVDPDLNQEAAVKLKNEIIASSFIGIALKLVNKLGIHTVWSQSEILVENEYNDGLKMTMEPDWRVAASWYAKAAVASKVEFNILGLNRNSLQKERKMASLFKTFGVETTYTTSGIILTKRSEKIKKFEHDFSSYPEIIPAFVVTCVLKRIPFKVKGINALGDNKGKILGYIRSSLASIGFIIDYIEDGDILFYSGKSKIIKTDQITLRAADPPRLAMSLNVIAFSGKTLIYKGSRLAPRSCPEYWELIQKLGFSVI